jgi:NAD(P)-dependent dehydrogenase (short-subunit alcohol dehydrogenase family)
MTTVCVTGVASGIGAATAARLVGDGVRVIGVDLADADITADLSDPAQRVEVIERVAEACGGRLDGFVPCAGVGGLASAELTVRLNYFSVVQLALGLRPALEAANGAAVLLSSNSTTSTPGLTRDDAHVYLAGDEDAAVAHFAEAGWIAYPAGKLALAYWVRANAPAWIAGGVRLNAVAPGVIDTGMTRPLRDIPGVSDALDRIPIPVGRWGTADEIAAVIAFLLSSDAGYVVGQTIFVDGGTDVVLQPTSHPNPLPHHPSEDHGGTS